MLAAVAAAVTLQARLSTVAQVPVSCPAAWTDSHDGLYYWQERRISLSPRVCRALSWIGDPQVDAPAAVGYAVFVFAHELQHAAGVTDERAADCGAAGSFLTVAGRLRAPPRLAARLAVASALVDGYTPSETVGCWAPMSSRSR